MEKKYKTILTRRRALSAVGAAGPPGIAECSSGDSSREDVPRPTAEEQPREEGIETWGKELIRHAEEAGIDWQMFEDEGIEPKFRMGLHKYSTTTEPLIPYFEDLTGNSVEYEIFEENRYWREARNAMNRQEDEFAKRIPRHYIEYVK